MRELEYVEQERSLGASVHLSDGVWWRWLSPSFCKPAFPFKQLTPGEAGPSWHLSLLGYSHQVRSAAEANTYSRRMVLDGEALREFGMQSLKSSKRARIRKGIRLLSIKPIDDLERNLPDLQQINISQAVRTQHGLPPEYYSDQYDVWRRKQIVLSKLPGRLWMGAFSEDNLIAYIYGYQVEHVFVIDTAKSHTDHLAKCPNDGLLFKVLELARDLPGCRAVHHGGGGERPTLQKFKELYGFKDTLQPVYSNRKWLYETAKRVVNDMGSVSEYIYRYALRSSMKSSTRGKREL